MTSVRRQEPGRLHWMHLRKYEDGKLMASGGAPICFKFGSHNTLVFAITRCNEAQKDLFCKKQGRDESARKLEELDSDVNLDSHTFMAHVMPYNSEFSLIEHVVARLEGVMSSSFINSMANKNNIKLSIRSVLSLIQQNTQYHKSKKKRKKSYWS